MTASPVMYSSPEMQKFMDYIIHESPVHVWYLNTMEPSGHHVKAYFPYRNPRLGCSAKEKTNRCMKNGRVPLDNLRSEYYKY